MAYHIKQYHGTYNRSRRYSRIQFIVVHYTAGSGGALENCLYFSRGNRNASADYFIDEYDIYEYSDPGEGYCTWAVGDGNGRYGITNQNSVSIEVCNMGGPFSESQINMLAWLTQKLMAKYGVPACNVVRHYDASRKHCPRYYVDSGRWKELHARITGGKIEETTTEGEMTVNVTLNVLSQGCKHTEQVKTLQRLLQALGYSVGSYGIDGSFGPATAQAVLQYQRDHGLEADCYVGSATWNSLLK